MIISTDGSTYDLLAVNNDGELIVVGKYASMHDIALDLIETFNNGVVKKADLDNLTEGPNGNERAN